MAMTQGIAPTLDDALLIRLLGELGREAGAFRFEIAPNPAVGAAVLSGERVVAKGFHRVYGEAHAEVDALRRAAETDVPSSAWDTMLVTLEPCSSTGKTGPCVDAILAAGIRRVVVGALDPDTRHQGLGLEKLREAGVDVLLLDGASPLSEVSPHFLKWVGYERTRRPRPWIIAKWAQTRTGQLQPPQDVGEGRWISGPAAREEVHFLRGHVDAVVTGVGTVLEDNPRLTVRGEAARRATQAPRRVVLDSYLRTPPESALFDALREDEVGGPVDILCLAGPAVERHRALTQRGARVHGLHADERDSVDLWDAYTWLFEQGCRRVLLECGPTLLRRSLELGFVDQIRVYTGSVNGGRGPSLGPELAQARLAERLDREVGEDTVLEAWVEGH